RTKGAKRDTGAGESRDWLLIKKPDAWAAAEGSRPWNEESVLSGLSLDELRSGARTEELDAELARLSVPRREPGEPGDPFVDPQPMTAENAERAFDRPGWFFELKYDGFRLFAMRDGQNVRLQFRRGSDATTAFPELARALRALPWSRVLLDGELVVL